MPLGGLALLLARRLRDLWRRTTTRAYQRHGSPRDDGTVVGCIADGYGAAAAAADGEGGDTRFRWAPHGHRMLCGSTGKDLGFGDSAGGDSTCARVSILHRTRSDLD